MKFETLTARETEPSNVVGEDHLHPDGHMLPSAEVVASPHRTKTLRPSEERAREHEWACWGICPGSDRLRCEIRLWRGQSWKYERRQFTYEEHSVDVVKVAVLPTAIVNVLTGHADFGAVEDSGLETLFKR